MPVSPESQPISDESEARLRAILDTTVDGIVTIDDRGVIESVNPAAERLFGYPAAELVERNVSMLMPLPFAAEHDEYIGSYLDTGDPKIIGIGREVEGKRKDGTTFPIDLAVSEFSVGEKRYFTGVIRDLTSRKGLEREAVETQRTLTRLVGNLPGLVYRCRNEPRWDAQYMGGMCLALTGYEPQEFVEGKIHFIELIHENDRERVWNAVQLAVAMKKAFELTYRIHARDGTLKWVWEQGCGVFDDAGVVVFLEGYITDITDRKEAEIHGRQQEKLAAVGQLASGVAHEIGNPLSSISAVAQGMRRKTDDPEMARKLDLVGTHIDRVTKIIRQMVDFSRPPRTEWKCASVNDVLRDAIGIVQYDKRARLVELDVTYGSDLPAGYVMPDLLGQVCINLALNAFDALASLAEGSERTLRIATRAKSDASGVEISFEDSGPGIPEEIASRIFEPFFTTKDVGKGTGLGLAVSHGIISEHGGTIRLDSRPGGGATFVVDLPILSESPEGSLTD